MEHFPIFMSLRDRTCLVVGGGPMAARKASALVRAGARVSVVASECCDEMADMIVGGRVSRRASRFEDSHIDGAVVVFAATGDRTLNARIARLGRLRGIPVNVPDDPELCGFIMPAVIDRSPITVAVSSGGASPTLARWARARIDRALPSSLGGIAAMAKEYRHAMRRSVRDPVTRRRIWDRFVDAADAAGHRAAEATLRDAMAHPADQGRGEVYLVGAGPGDPQLLTLRAHRLLQQADVIVHDALVSPAVLELARRDARRIDAGKRMGRHTMSQPAINALLVRLAREGNRVVRLKGGDPFIFGRGGEEMAALRRAGIPCHGVPGITAAAGCAASAGIPLTHRGHAREIVFATAHGRHGPASQDWADLARRGRTLVIYMGLSQVHGIAMGLISGGLARDTPAVVIENGTMPSERRVAGTLETLPGKVEAASMAGPALIIVGAVAGLATQEAASADSHKVAEAAVT